MDLLFGKMITTFNGLATGSKSPEEFRSEMNRFTYAASITVVLLILHSLSG